MGSRLSKKKRTTSPRARVGQQAGGLLPHALGGGQRAAAGGGAQGLVGHARPEEVRQARGHLVAGGAAQAGAGGIGRALLDPVEEVRRLQHGLDDGGDGAAEAGAVQRAGRLGRAPASSSASPAASGRRNARGVKPSTMVRAQASSVAAVTAPAQAASWPSAVGVGGGAGGDPLGDGGVLLGQQAGHRLPGGVVAEAVAQLLGGQQVGRRGGVAQQVADGVVVLEAGQPAQRRARGPGAALAAHLGHGRRGRGRGAAAGGGQAGGGAGSPGALPVVEPMQPDRPALPASTTARTNR